MRFATGMVIAVLRGAQEDNVNFVLSLVFQARKKNKYGHFRQSFSWRFRRT